MSLLWMIRHGQAASVVTGDYDQLSPLGREQSRRLGEYWLTRGVTFDHVYIGPRRRHRQTHDVVAAVFHAHGVAWPSPTVLPELDEYQAENLLRRAVPLLCERDPQVAELVTTIRRGEAGAHRSFEVLLRRVTRGWVSGEFELPDVESWPAFRDRIRLAVETMTTVHGRGKNVVAFTSAGAVAAAVGRALRLDDAAALELMWVINNVAVTEFLFTRGRFSLGRFNCLAHLSDPAMITSR